MNYVNLIYRTAHNLLLNKLTTIINFGVLTTLVCSVAFSCKNTEPDERKPDPMEQKIDNIVLKAMKKYRIPGIAVGIMKNGQLLHKKAYGLLDVGLKVKATDTSLFQIASVSKTIAGIAVLKLVEENQLDLDAYVSEYVNDLPAATDSIKINQLLSHTSGLRNKWENPRYHQLNDQERDNITAIEVIELSSELPLNFKPGNGWSYSQSGFTLIGLIIETISGLDYEEFVKTEIFEPSGMTSSIYGGSSLAIKGARPAAYFYEDNVLKNWFWPFGPTDFQSSGLNTSLNDMISLMKALDSGSILSKSLAPKLWEPVLLDNGESSGYGLGWALIDFRNEKIVGHEGGGACWLGYLPEQNLSIVILSNRAGSKADDLQIQLFTELSK